MSNAILYINNSTTEAEINISGTSWVAVDPDNDTLIFSEGGSGVADGEDLPTEEELNRAATQLSAIAEVVVSKYFLADNNVNLLKEIMNAGNQNKQYAFAVDFDGATASEPQLEAWDNEDLDSYIDPSLGSGTPANSWYKAVATKSALPGADWTGTPLAGSGAGNIVLLNEGNGALSVADTLYFNFKIEIPAGYVTPAAHTPVLTVTYLTN